MIELFLLTSIATATTPPPLVTKPPAPIYTPPPKPTYNPPPPPKETWSDKMWQRYKGNGK
jgi:hypothetical protein